MKFFIAFALIATVASAAFNTPIKPTVVPSEIHEIIAAINNPSTDPATAAALEQMLLDFYGVEGSPISVGPVIVENPEPEPISVDPVIVDPVIVNPSPVAVPESSSAPLVQIILNINQAQSGPVAIPPGVALIPEIVGEPVQIVDSPPETVQVVETPAVVDPVLVVESAPTPAEPIIVSPPILPVPIITLPDELN
ncbi:cytadherence high molecular weight protein 3-like [Galleria mellonella]|uniref:Cytadherence high molecular weight protein 3-like n=1 Tax=Galleria mellonella TaxID=7137 RepID=A0A6J1X854_GALME|nr:cytadherence high molecular weight protein 3-like [Galleria mellonella]